MRHAEGNPGRIGDRSFHPPASPRQRDLGILAFAVHAAVLLIFFASLLHAVTPLPLGAPRRWRIVPIGDSITQGNTNHLTYRYYLWQMLIDAGVDFDFVGSISHYDIINPAIPPYRGHPFDFDHEGRVFYQTGQIAGSLPQWLTVGHAGSGGYMPDIALIHAGTNDALLARPLAESVTNLTSIIATLQAHNPQVIVLLAKIIPTFNPLDSLQQANANVNGINSQIAGIAAAMDSPSGKPNARVIVVDQNSGFLANHTLAAPLGGDTYDGVHPSPAGEEKMALRWLEALQLVIAAPTVSRDPDGRLSVDFLRVKNSSRISYRLGVASTPEDWDWSAGATEVASVTSTSQWTERVHARDAAAGLARFLKVEIVLDDTP